jgi:hypothetical protein
MQFLDSILFVCFIFFLFTLYVLGHDDFVLFRKNIDMEKIFNLAFLSTFAGLFLARLFFVILYFKKVYLNPLAFALFPYFPGLSLPAALLGSSLALFFLFGGKKYPEGRIFDFFTTSFFVACCIGNVLLLIITFVTTKHISIVFAVYAIFLLLLAIISSSLTKNHAIKEGSSGLICIIFFSVIAIGVQFLIKPIMLIPILKESSIWIIDMIVATTIFLKHDSPSAFFKGVFKK